MLRSGFALAAALVVTLSAACSHPPAASVPASSPPPPRSDGGAPPPPADAAPPPADAPSRPADAAPAPAVFEPPPALPAPAPPTPASARCRTTTDEDQAREEGRERAALDAALRAQGFTPLEIEGGDMAREGSRGPRPPSGKVIALSGGRHAIVVGTIAGCGGEPPVVAMTATHEVFVVEPELVARSTRKVLECTTTCTGVCGANMPDVDALALVPADATLGAPRTIRVPIAIRVVFGYAKQERCDIP